ncbi:CHRD domain-containing protein [Fibrella sp. HMF5335]|uniref:CHRD domain-containing protein n=1 Tax=Fibrella rubiginis TaxID=2817060 RepID=A0A939GBW5_9BACT|nr:CHRD domain-containing protein [Fibrella rubiginis]MBO0936064.1 CHRD domain-containing protein [Fibrella rubiginis]
MKKGIILVMGLVASTSFFACKNDNNTVVTPTTKTIFSAVLNGASEKPTSTTSPATGTFEGSLENTTNVMSYTLTYKGFPTSSTVTMGHLHEVTPNSTSGVNGTGPAVIPFGTLASPIVGTTTLTQARVDSMKNGFFYANIHTNDFPGGAIRGNLVRQN